VAVVNGQTVTVVEFNQAFQELIEMARQKFGQSLNDELIKKLNLRSQAIEQIISRELILQAAEKAGVYIDDEAVLYAIRNQPAFQEDSRFSPYRYQQVLAANRLEPADYEASTRQDLTIRRMESRLGLLSQVSQAEALAYFHWLFDEVQISYVAFDPEIYKPEVELAAEALSAFFNEQKEAYRIPEKIELEYLVFRPEDYLAEVSVNPDEVREVYELTQESYARPERARLRHILFTVPANAAAEEEQKIKAEAEKVLAKIKSGADFTELAKKHSQGPAAAEGGEVGWIERGQLAPEMAEAVFSLKPGQSSDLLRSAGGFHIIKVEEKQEAKLSSFEEARAEIEEQLKKEAAKEKALEAAEEAYGLSFGAENLDELAAQLNKKSVRVKPFSRDDAPEGPVSNPEFIEAVFSLSEGEAGPVIELDDGFYVALVKGKTPSYLPTLEEAGDQVRKDFIQEEAKKLAKAGAENFLKTAPGGDWLNLAQEAGLIVQVPASFTRQAEIENLGYDMALNEAAFGLSQKNPWPGRVFEVGGMYVVIHFENRLKASQEVFEKRKAGLMEALKSQRQRELSNAWLKALHQRAKIEIDKNYL